MRLDLCLCLVVFSIIISCKCTQALPAPADTSPETYPFHAVVKGAQTCSGILISEDYVITPASCINGVSNVSIYLGFRGYPYYRSNYHEPNGQILHCNESNYAIHEKYVKISDDRHFNNIALIKLSTPANLTKTVQPGKLISKEEYRLLEGKTVALNVTGWKLSTNSKMMVAKVKLRTQKSCSDLFGDKYFKDQENCVEWFTNPRLNLLGNAVSSNGKVIGYQTKTDMCVKLSSSCSRNDVILSIVPFLDWISQKMQNHAAVELQIDDEEIKRLHSIIKEIKEQQQNDIEGLKKKVDDALRLDEQANSLKSEIENNEIKQNESLLKLQEELRETRTEITDGLSEQKAQYEKLFKLIEALGKSSPHIDDRFHNIETSLENIRNATDANTFNIAEIGNKNLHAINNLNDKLVLLERDNKDLQKQQLSPQDFAEQLGSLNGTLRQLELKNNKKFDKINEEVRSISTKNEEEVRKINTRLGLLENLLMENSPTIKRNEENIATIFKTLKDMELRVKECCSRFDYEEPPPA